MVSNAPWNPDPSFAPPPPRDPDRAAKLTWLGGAASLLLFGCCGGSFVMTGIMATTDQLAQQLPLSGLPADARQMIRPFVIFMGSAALGLMALPGLINLVLGFHIQRGKAGAARLAGWLMIGQVVIAAGVLLMGLLGNLSLGNVLGLAFNLVVVGGYVALLVAAIRAVRPLRRGGSAGQGPIHGGAGYDDDEEPWNAPGG